MKTPASLLLVSLVGIAAFLAGNRSAGGGGEAAAPAPGSGDRPMASRSERRPPPDSTRRERGRTASDELSADDAKRLTPEERAALLNRAALLSDPNKQAKVICGLIAAMSKDELSETTSTLLQIQHRGNAWSQAVWNELWTQWGRVDPQACLELTAYGGGLNTGEDYRRMMSGWLETDPAGALEWAKRPGLNERESIAAAFAISSEAGTDLGRLQSAILAIPDNPVTARAALHDYFDLALASEEDPALSTVYERMDPALQQAAWPVMVQRLAYSDPDQMVEWLKAHANDPGRDYRPLDFYRMARADPAAMVAWAALLPVAGKDDPDASTPHPAIIAVSHWLRQDRQAASAWLKTQPADTPWSAIFSRQEQNHFPILPSP